MKTRILIGPLLFLLIVTAGCVTLDDSIYQSGANANNKVPLKVGLEVKSDSTQIGPDIMGDEDNNRKVRQAIIDGMKDVFQSVEVLPPGSAGGNGQQFDVLAYANGVFVPMPASTSISLELRSPKNGRPVGLYRSQTSYQDTIQKVMSIAFLSGLLLCVPCPISMPYGLDLEKTAFQKSLNADIGGVSEKVRLDQHNLLAALDSAVTPGAPAVAGGQNNGLSAANIAAIVKATVSGMQESHPTSDQPQEVPVSSVDTPRYALTPKPDDYALVIGIERYSTVPSATFAKHDADAVRAHLVALGVPSRNIMALDDDRATKSAIATDLEVWLPENVSPKSTVFIYFSGHGAPDPDDRQAYLVPWDGNPEFLKTTGYSMKRLYRDLGELNVRHIVVVIDSCFSGAGGRSVLAPGTRPLVTRLKDGFTSGNGKILALTASGPNEISGVLPLQGHGLFTYYFLKGLNGEARDDSGQVTVRSLYQYLSPKVEDSARRKNRTQDPKLLPSFGKEDLVLR